MEALTELQAAKTLLDEGVRIPIPAPLFLRMFGKKNINLSIKQPSAGTSLRVIKYRLSMEVTDDFMNDLSVDDALKLQVKHGFKIARITALLILGGKLRGWLFSRLLASFLMERIQFKTMLSVMMLATLGSGVEDFTDTIRLTRMLRLTAPKLSQETQKS